MLMIESDAGGAAAEAELDAAEAACREAAGARSLVRSADAAPRPTGCARRAGRRTGRSSRPAWRAWRTSACRAAACAELLAAIERPATRHGLRVGVFGHAGDGNFHPTFVMDRDDPAAEARIDAVRADLFAEVLALGGTISGEHGTGVVKRDYLAAQRGARAVEVMRAIKAALDPQGILNPGKVFPD